MTPILGQPEPVLGFCRREPLEQIHAGAATKAMPDHADAREQIPDVCPLKWSRDDEDDGAARVALAVVGAQSCAEKLSGGSPGVLLRAEADNIQCSADLAAHVVHPLQRHQSEHGLTTPSGSSLENQLIWLRVVPSHQT